MKISFFINTMERGGAERVISILANHYQAMGWDVDVVLVLKNKVEYDLDNRIRVVDFTFGDGSYKSRAPKWLTHIRAYLKKEKPDCVVSFIGRTSAVVLTAALGLRCPIVVSERNDPHRDGRGKAMLAYCNLIYNKAKAIVFQTKYQQTCFSDRLAGKSCIIPNPVNTSVRRHSVEPLRIVTSGRLEEQKNQAMLIRAMAELVKEFPDLQCEIYGEGSLRPALEAQVRELDLTEHVFLPGNIKSIHEEVSKGYIFVMTSEFEGLSNALIEALQIGLPCVTTDYDGADELIRDGENGLIVGCGNTSELVEAIRKLLTDREAYERFSAAAEKSGKQYLAEAVLKRWDEAVEKAMKK